MAVWAARLLSYHAPLVRVPGQVGRPRFAITREQLLYLASLGFKWTEIAPLLGVSRMTIGVVTHIAPVEPFATGIKLFDH